MVRGVQVNCDHSMHARTEHNRLLTNQLFGDSLSLQQRDRDGRSLGQTQLKIVHARLCEEPSQAVRIHDVEHLRQRITAAVPTTTSDKLHQT